jgi:hypothetical protein
MKNGELGTAVSDKKHVYNNKSRGADLYVADLSGTLGTISLSHHTEPTRGATLIAFGTTDFLVDIAQQVSWLTASIRLPICGKLSYSDVLFLSTEVRVYKAIPLPLQTLRDEEDSCWFPLFLGTVIARDYPIPKRDQEKGLELPFHLMTTMAGPLYPMTHDGGIYLKGYSRLLLPTSLSKGDSVQWHLVKSPARRERLPPDTIHHHSWQRIGNAVRLAHARTFLGYCRRVVIELGTSKPRDYYRGILFSSAHDENHGPSIQAPSSFTWGSSGLGIFGAAVSNPITYGKALAKTINGDNDSYLDVLDLAMERPVILYDDSLDSERGWMVPTLSVIYHVIHTWASHNDACTGQLPFAELTWQTGEAAKALLTQNWDFVLRETSSEEMSKQKLVKDLVMQYWGGIQQRAAENLKAECQSTPETELGTPRLYGWDYMDIVRGKHSRRKQLQLDGNWKELTENVQVLFGQDFGDIIRPAPGISICRQWDPIPSRKKYLTATIDCLRQLAWERGGHHDSLISSRLTNERYWNHRTNDLFVDCGSCSRRDLVDPARYSKRSQSLESSAERRAPSLIPPSEGAIVFGSHSEVLHKPVPVDLPTPLVASGRDRIEPIPRIKEVARRVIWKIANRAAPPSALRALGSDLLCENQIAVSQIRRCLKSSLASLLCGSRNRPDFHHTLYHHAASNQKVFVTIHFCYTSIYY